MFRELLRRSALPTIIVLMSGLAVSACGGGGGGSKPPPTGTLEVVVTDSGEEPGAIAGARVTVIDGGSGQIVTILTTDGDGRASLVLPVGQVQLKIAAQGFEPSPASAHGSPLPYAILGGEKTTASYRLTPLENAGELGWITGRTLEIDGSTGLANALVLATMDGEWYTTSSDGQGGYVLFNVPAGDVELTALRAGHNFQTHDPVPVQPGAGSEDWDIHSSEATASVSGKVQFLAISNIIVDITLLHPETGEVVPGLRTFNDSSWNYALHGIPDGTFQAIASLETDGRVLDPDHVRKFGVPEIAVTVGVPAPAELDFALTGAVELTTPENFQVLPIDEITFRWKAYPSAKNYILELIDDKGNVIWGGIEDPDLQLDVTESHILGTVTQFTFDPVAEGVPLEIGGFYRLHVYASDNINTDPFYKLISASEDLEGVFQVGPPTGP